MGALLRVDRLVFVQCSGVYAALRARVACIGPLPTKGVSGERREVDLNTLVDEALNLADHGARAQHATFNVTL